jgi:pimeloyl-ACP methyl ester carboxylesterase
MTDTPETRYTRSADGTNLAYQVSGDGPVEVLFIHSAAIPIDLLSEDPGFIRLRRRLDRFSRTLWFDARGLGASEGNAWDSRALEIVDSDLTAMLDAVGFERPAIVGGSVRGPTAIHFSVTHPERVSALVLYNSYAHYVQEDDYPWGIPREGLEGQVTRIKELWGTPPQQQMLAPSRVADERFRAWYTRPMRSFGGPDRIADLVRALWEADVRALLPSISIPTPVLHRAGADGNNLAYQLTGDGPLDLLFLPGSGIPIDLLSDDPGFIRFRRRLDSSSRTLWFDGRGMGASEGNPRDARPREVTEADLTAVPDAVGFKRAALGAEVGRGPGAATAPLSWPAGEGATGIAAL